MRKVYMLLGCCAALAGCKGAGLESAGSTSVTPSGSVSAGSGGGVTTGSSSGSGSTSGTFLDVSTATTFNAIGGLQSLKVGSTGGTLYQGNASTVRSPSGTIAYDPRDGVFTMTLADTKAGVSNTFRFQDPAHRTAFTGTIDPQSGVPNLNDFNYLEGLSGDNDVTTFFYQRPGSSTNYVSLAGYVRNNLSDSTNPIYERGAMVFGSLTSASQVPGSGTGTFKGGFLATMINNPDVNTIHSNFQWITGNSTVTVDFGKSTVGLALSGTVSAAFRDGAQVPDGSLATPTGSTFTASGTAAIDMVSKGGFTGSFQNAQFATSTTTNGVTTTTTTPIDFASVSSGSSTAGASSIDGAFYGPNAVNVGGNFRIVGGIPNQRVDILGAFAGAKQ